MYKRVCVLSAFLALVYCTPILAERQFQVACGLVQASGEDPDPGFWSTLQGSSLKPTDWQFSNPHNNVPGNYWLTNLAELTLQELLDYDLVLITNHQPTPFTPEENQKIQQWVSQGGMIWVDDCGYMAPQGFFMSFDFVSYDGHSMTGNKETAVPDHAFFNNIYQLTADELANLGHPEYSSHVIGYEPASWSELLYNNSDGQHWTDMLLAHYGKGYIIVSADDYGCAVNDFGQAEDIKFSYNILDWAQTIPEPMSMLTLSLGSCLLLAYRRPRISIDAGG